MQGLNVKFGATDAGFTSTVGKINNSMGGMEKNVKQASTSMTSSFSTMVKAGAALALGFGAIKLAIAGVRGVIDNFGEAIDMGGRLNDLSSRTGETAGNLLLLERAFQNSGAGAEKVGPAINKMQRAIVEAGQGVITYKRAFDALGISLSDMKGMTPTEQMQLLAQRLSEVQNPTERSAIAMQILGRSGGELIPLFRNFAGEMRNAKGELGSLPGIMDRSNESFDAISDRLAVVKGKMTEFAAGILSKTLPAIELIVTGLSRIDAAGIGERLASAFIGAQDAMNGFGSAVRAVKAGEFSLAWQQGMASIKLQVKQTINEIYKNFIATVSAAKTFLISVIGPDSAIWLAIQMGMDLLVGKFQAGILNAALGLADTFPRIFGNARENINNNIDVTNRGIEQTKSLLSNLFSDGYIQNDMKDAAKAFPETFKNAYNDTKPLMDLTADLENVEKLQQEINKTAAGLTYNMMDDVKEMPKHTFNMMDHLRTGAKAIEKAAAKVKEVMGLSQKIADDIKAAEGKLGIDKGGKLEAKARQQIADGDLRGAERTRKRLAENEKEAELRGVGKERDARNVRDIAKELGIDTFGKSRKDLRAEILAKRQAELKPGQQGKDQKQVEKEKGGAKPAVDPLDMLNKAVASIRDLVAKIEPKLPQHALN